MPFPFTRRPKQLTQAEFDRGMQAALEADRVAVAALSDAVILMMASHSHPFPH